MSTYLSYLLFRLLVTGPAVKILMKYLPYYAAVFVIAELSFVYDNILFAQIGIETDHIISILVANVLYVTRVLAAWYFIKVFWNTTENYWIAVLIGTNLTFVADFFILGFIYA